ncbi:cell division protein ZipA [Rodentibacter myodis]|uniref:Cell division protein ZipA n=1 Tax=Rodentibacter myodis TaxID=1907939 RepID=A0A1V3JIR6_9PAST|nr:cell division protein ZipA [Rodentibacter myodis]OOF56339.1 cell division protein ZipA [Rodentibacter myodis]
MDLNTILIILGVAALIALIAHGLWSNRREKSKYFENATTFNRTSIQEQPEPPQQSDSESLAHQTQPDFLAKAPQQPIDYDKPTSQVNYDEIARTVDDIKISIPDTQPPREPMRMEYNMRPSANSPKLSQEDNEFDNLNASLEQTSPAALNETNEMTSTVHFNEARTSEPSVQKQTSGYIQLYVISPQHREFQTTKLTQSLENLGFILGERNMYHRHFDLSVASPTLFSVANLQDDGAFNPYNVDSGTIGVALFMKLPSPGNNLANLKLMILAAKTLAEDLGGSVLTEDEQIFDDYQEQLYLSRV